MRIKSNCFMCVWTLWCCSVFRLMQFFIRLQFNTKKKSKCDLWTDPGRPGGEPWRRRSPPRTRRWWSIRWAAAWPSSEPERKSAERQRVMLFRKSAESWKQSRQSCERNTWRELLAVSILFKTFDTNDSAVWTELKLSVNLLTFWKQERFYW